MQGTDYIHYYNCYYAEHNIFEVLKYGFVQTQFDLLYNLMVSIFRTLNIPFSLFIVCINVIILILYHRFFKYFSESKILSLLLLYMLYGIVFIESALRQGIAIAILLGICLPAYKEKNIRDLLLGIIIAFLFHKSSIIFSITLLTIFYIFVIKKQEVIKINKKILFLIFIIFLLINFFPYQMIFSPFASQNDIAFKIVYYFSTSRISIFAFLLRIIYLLFFSYILYYKKINIMKCGNEIYFLYLMGIFLYFMFFRFSILSRVTVYFEILEIVIFANFINDNLQIKSKYINILICLYLLISCVLFVKDGIATQTQSNYEKVSIIYPYHHLFENW